MKRAAIYARVSPGEGRVAGQLEQLRTYAAARGWSAREWSDARITGALAHRPGLDEMMLAVRRREVDAIVITKLDRLARSVHHLVTVARELEDLGVDLVVTDQAIDTSTLAGKLLFHILAAIAEFERGLIHERVMAGLARAKTHGTRSGKPIGRPRRHFVSSRQLEALRTEGLSLRAIARRLRVHPEAVRRAATNLGPARTRDCAETEPLAAVETA